MEEDLRTYLQSVRRDFANLPLEETDAPDEPFTLFKRWFDDSLKAQLPDPYSMILATSGTTQIPSSRVVYMRDFDANGLTFFTNYQSQKGRDIAANPNVALLFFWNGIDRQVHLKGKATKVEESVSDNYFASRPRASQLGAWASAQSEVIPSRYELDIRLEEVTRRFEGQEVPRPPHWGGYIVKPYSVEFWQGRPSRLHDRLRYLLQEQGSWLRERLAP